MDTLVFDLVDEYLDFDSRVFLNNVMYGREFWNGRQYDEWCGRAEDADVFADLEKSGKYPFKYMKRLEMGDMDKTFFKSRAYQLDRLKEFITDDPETIKYLPRDRVYDFIRLNCTRNSLVDRFVTDFATISVPSDDRYYKDILSNFNKLKVKCCIINMMMMTTPKLDFSQFEYESILLDYTSECFYVFEKHDLKRLISTTIHDDVDNTKAYIQCNDDPVSRETPFKCGSICMDCGSFLDYVLKFDYKSAHAMSCVGLVLKDDHRRYSLLRALDYVFLLKIRRLVIFVDTPPEGELTATPPHDTCVWICISDKPTYKGIAMDKYAFRQQVHEFFNKVNVCREQFYDGRRFSVPEIIMRQEFVKCLH